MRGDGISKATIHNQTLKYNSLLGHQLNTEYFLSFDELNSKPNNSTAAHILFSYFCCAPMQYHTLNTQMDMISWPMHLCCRR